MKNVKIILIAAAFLLLAAFCFCVFIDNRQPPEEAVTYQKFLRMAENGEITEAVLTGGPEISFKTADGRELKTNNPRSDQLKENLLMLGIAVEEGEYVSIMEFARSAFSLMALFTLAFLMYRKINKHQGKAVLGMELSAETAKAQAVFFDDVAGNFEAKESVSDIVDFIKNPRKYSDIGARMPNGILLYGPPGTGKTLMARAVAGEAEVPFYAVSGSDFVQMYVGVGAARVRGLFKKARQAGKAVIFIDEIDALGKKRAVSVQAGGNDERDQTLNALLTEMSGFCSGEGIVVIAATNRLDILDEALLRPGRFDRQIEIGLPDVDDRERILLRHMRGKPFDPSADIRMLAKQTVYFSGAMLENMMNEAAIFAAKRSSTTIGAEDIDNAYYAAVVGSEKKSGHGAELDKRITAYHEAGHALAAKLVSPENTVAKVTIIPSTKGLGGFCLNIPADKRYFTKQDIEAQVKIALAGRAAEEIVFGADMITTGAANDLSKVQVIIRDYIETYAMGTISQVCWPGSEVVKESCRLTEKFYAEIREALLENRYKLQSVASALLERESLNAESLSALL